MSDSEVAERLDWIQSSLSKGAVGATLWWGGWLSYATAEASYGWVKYASTHDRLDRDLWLVTGLGSSLWIAQMLVFPMTPAYASLRLKRVSQRSPAERRLALLRAEHLLRDAARSERESLHWSEHVLDLGWALGSAAYLVGRNYGDVPTPRLYRETGLELGLTILLSEAAILTTPRKALRDVAAYRARGCADEALKARPPNVARALSWSMQVRGTGTAFSLHF